MHVQGVDDVDLVPARARRLHDPPVRIEARIAREHDELQDGPPRRRAMPGQASAPCQSRRVRLRDSPSSRAAARPLGGPGQLALRKHGDCSPEAARFRPSDGPCQGRDLPLRRGVSTWIGELARGFVGVDAGIEQPGTEHDHDDEDHHSTAPRGATPSRAWPAAVAARFQAQCRKVWLGKTRYEHLPRTSGHRRTGHGPRRASPRLGYQNGAVKAERGRRKIAVNASPPGCGADATAITAAPSAHAPTESQDRRQRQHQADHDAR